MRDFQIKNYGQYFLLLAAALVAPHTVQALEHTKVSKIGKIAVYSMAKTGVRQGTVEITFTDAVTNWDNYCPPACQPDKAWFSKNEAHLMSSLLTYWSMGIPVTVTIDDTHSIIGGACEIISFHVSE